MNVLLINTYDTGGAAIACIRLHKALLNAGVHSKILFLHKTNNHILESYGLMEDYKNQSKLRWTFKHVHYYVDLALKIFKTKALEKGYEPFQFPSSVFDITRHPLYEWADIINLHWVANFLDWRSFFKKNKKPIVWTLHDMLPFTGGYHYETGFPLEAYRKLIAKNLKTKQKALKGQEIHVVALNQKRYKKSSPSEVFQHFPHSVIPNSIDTHIFQPYKQNFAREVFGLPLDKKVLLFVADLTYLEIKGFNYLLEALKWIDDEVFLAVLGKQTDSLKDFKNVFQFGFIKDERLMALAYSASDLFVIPSIEENLPNTVMESIVCGTPVVGFSIGGIPEMIAEGKNGFLCEEISSAALAKTIQKALETKWNNNWIRQDAVNRYDQSVQAEKYVSLFKTVLNKK